MLRSHLAAEYGSDADRGDHLIAASPILGSVSPDDFLIHSLARASGATNANLAPQLQKFGNLRVGDLALVE